MVTKKTEGTTTIEVSIATYNKLYGVKEQIAKILRKRTVSFDTLFKVFFAVQPLEVILQEMILEEGVETSWKKKTKS